MSLREALARRRAAEDAFAREPEKEALERPKAPAPESAGAELLPRPRECFACRGGRFWPTRHGWWACWRCHPPAPGELEAGMALLRLAGARGAPLEPLFSEARRLIEEVRRRLWLEMPASLREAIDPRPEMQCDVSASPLWSWAAASRPDLLEDVSAAASAWWGGLLDLEMGAGADRMRRAAEMVEAAWRRVYEAWEAWWAEEEPRRAG